MKLAGPHPRIGLSRYLLRLTLATLLPLIVFALVAGWLFARHERQTFERGAEERVRALATAVDAELRGVITSLQTLAQSNALREGDLADFYAIALRVKKEQPGWLSITVAVPETGQQLVNVLRPFGAALPPVPERASFDAVVATHRPAIGDLGFGPLSQKTNFVVRVPVLVDRQLRYVLSAVIDPALVQDLLAEQRFPAGWTGVVVDRQRHVVARSVRPESTVGKPASPTLRGALAGARQGSMRGITLDGDEVYTTFFTSAFSDWSVAVAAPVQALEAGARLAAGQLLAGAALALLAAMGLARWLGERISAPIGQLAARARRLAEGEPDTGAATAPAQVLEIAQLAAALDQAVTATHDREAAQGELAAVTTNASLALFKLDAQGHCLYLNPAAEAMTGYTLAETHGTPLHTLMHPHRPDGAPSPFEAGPLVAALGADERRQGEDVFVHKSGRFFPIAFTSSPIRRDGAPVGLIVEVRDIGDEKRAEAERAVLLARERQRRAEAEAANRGKDEFLAMLGHELRNPLGAIGNASHVARLAPGSEHAARAQEVIGRQVTHLTRLVDDLLDAGRVASGKIVLARAPLDLADVVRRHVAVLAADGRAARHRIDCELGEAWVDGDETRLEQVVSNLLGNALRYTPAGGRITVRVAVVGKRAKLEVEDDGIGIPPELLPRLFDLFVQGSRGIERSQGGLGIGLTLVRRLSELHGGTVAAASAGEGRGSTFTVLLPRIAAPVAARAPAPFTGNPASTAAGGRRVLVVEDHEDVRAMLREALRLAGHEVHDRADGVAGIEAARATRPDVALIDIGLPGVSGYVVAERIRAEPGGNAILLVALTGYGQPEDRERSLAAGFDVHVTKPIDVAMLLATIARWPASVSPA